MICVFVLMQVVFVLMQVALLDPATAGRSTQAIVPAARRTAEVTARCRLALRTGQIYRAPLEQCSRFALPLEPDPQSVLAMSAISAVFAITLLSEFPIDAVSESRDHRWLLCRRRRSRRCQCSRTSASCRCGAGAPAACCPRTASATPALAAPPPAPSPKSAWSLVGPRCRRHPRHHHPPHGLPVAA